MKLEISKNKSKINAYEYRDNMDLSEIIIPDSVQIIGEGAFKNCKNLRKVTVGKGVRQIQCYAFDNIGKKLEIVWRSKTPYKSPFMKILPPFDEINSICAPYRAFEKAGKAEKFVLACGFIFHPEYEDEYSLEYQQQYKKYIVEGLPEHLNELCEKGMILDTFLICRKRNLILEKEYMKQFISYIRTSRMTKEEKELIDQIEIEEGLVEAEEDVADKKLCRYIRKQMNEEKMKEILAKEGLSILPAVSYKDSEHKAPAEALKYILTAYISQWTYMDGVPREFRVDDAADYVASLLNKEELCAALEKLALETDEVYPRRMVPFLRYAKDTQLEFFIEKSDEWKSYKKYGQAGILAKETFEKAVLINDSETALLYAYRKNTLAQYSFLRKTTVEELFLQVVDVLDKRNLLEEMEQLRKQFIHKLHVEYLSGKKQKRDQWHRFYMAHPTIRSIAETLVWETGEKNGPLFIMTEKGPVDEAGKSVVLEEACEIGIAHPVYMTTVQIRDFQSLLNKFHRVPCFQQLKNMKTKLDLGDWQLWNRRYYKLEIPYEKLQDLVKLGFQLDGRISERLRISYYGKVLMEAYVVENEKSGSESGDENPMMSLGYILGSNYNMRQINESVSLLDDAFCYEMILGGRMEAAPYLEQFDLEQIETLLEASIEWKHNENIAALLEQKEKMTNGKMEDDLELDW